MTKRPAFTLVELLVVIAILAVLIGVLLPVLSSARLAGQQAACLNNVRQHQIASYNYSVHNKGVLIEPGLSEGGGVDEEVTWLNTLRSWGSDDMVVRSPSDRSPHWPIEEGGQGVPLEGTEDRFRRTSYGINGLVTRFIDVEATPDQDPNAVQSQFFNDLDKINYPSMTIQFLLMAETGEFAGADHVHPDQWFVPFAPEASPKLAAEQSKIGAYGGGEATWRSVSNYGFLDGHAESRRFSGVYTDPNENNFDPRLR